VTRRQAGEFTPHYVPVERRINKILSENSAFDDTITIDDLVDMHNSDESEKPVSRKTVESILQLKKIRRVANMDKYSVEQVYHVNNPH